MTAIGAWLARSALMQSPIGGFLKMVPRWAWIALAGGVLVLLAVHWHAGKVEAFGNERYSAGYAQAKADIEAAAKVRDQADTDRAQHVNSTSARISQEEGNAVVEAHGRTDQLAADLLLRPSPKVRGYCSPAKPDVPGASVAGGRTDASGAAQPYGVVELTRAQWEELIRRAAGKDTDSETLTGWQNSYSRWYQTYQGWLADRAKIEGNSPDVGKVAVPK